MAKRISVAYISYQPGANPYQALFAKALEHAGCEVERIPPTKWFPLVKARVALQDHHIIQLDWPHDMYAGKVNSTKILKRMMYRLGLFAMRNKPLIWTVHNMVAHNSENFDDEMRMLQFLVDACSGFIFLSETTKAEFFQRFKVKPDIPIIVVYHGHYQESYDCEKDYHSAKSELGIQADQKTVLWLGRLQPYKGVEKLIETFSKVSTPGQQLVIAGNPSSDSYKSSIRQLVDSAGRTSSGNIVLHDHFIEESSLATYFAAADLCVFPFKSIANSGSVMAALSFGVPVIAPDAGSMPSVITPELGWLYPAEQTNGLDAPLHHALSLPNEDPEQRRQRRQLVGARYSWISVGQKAQELYRSTLHSDAA